MLHKRKAMTSRIGSKAANFLLRWENEGGAVLPEVPSEPLKRQSRLGSIVVRERASGLKCISIFNGESR